MLKQLKEKAFPLSGRWRETPDEAFFPQKEIYSSPFCAPSNLSTLRERMLQLIQ
jgi:hypothetical protein